MSARSAEPTRQAGLRRLNEFVRSAGTAYTKARNFDFGRERRNNVSMLSPYIRHRVILESEVLDATLQHHSASAADKFIQEVFWRSYFKGWLEHRPDVWANYRRSLAALIESLESDADLSSRYNDAVNGNTGIECFDAWIRELNTDGYLHNHARMWFASIWVFTLKLPWQLGADFFYRKLRDGDPASNTLSWRWVCGLHTKGKTYLARASNIARYTDKRFNPAGQLATHARPLADTIVSQVQPVRPPQVLAPDERFGLLITEEDCHPESLLGDQAPVAVLGLMATAMRSPLTVGPAACEFAEGAVADALNRAETAFDVAGKYSDAEDWCSVIVDWATQHKLDVIVTPYAPVGPVAESLSGVEMQLHRYGVRILQLRRHYDSICWPHAKRGFFNLKKQIPALLDALDIGRRPDASQKVAI